MRYIKLVPWVFIVVLGYGTLHFYGKVSGLQHDLTASQLETKQAKAKAQAAIEEYNALQELYTASQKRQDAIKEKTDEAKQVHRRVGSVVRASDADVRLLQQRSREVRGEPADASGKPN